MPDDNDSRPPEDESTVSFSPPEGEPERIGPYKILQKLGEGGMGVVYLAEQTEPIRRRVALKLIKLGMDSKQVIARFEAERQALALMNHANVSKVFDAGTTEQGRPYFVMEYVKGVPITEYCDQTRLTNRERLKLFIQVCEAIHHAHQKGIIHRDIKPSNVLVSVEDGTPAPKVIDFGVAKATAQHLTERTLFTQQGVLIGTPEYMSPEQAELTAQDVDVRTDVYSLGVVLYELLVGALPFEPRELREAGFDELRRKIREDEPPKPSTRLSTLNDRSTESARCRRIGISALQRQLRGDLDWITMKALEKDRTRRYPSPAALVADIQRHIRDEPVTARAPGMPRNVGKWIRRHKMAVLSTALVAVAVTAGFVVSRISELGVHNENDPQSQASSSAAYPSDRPILIVLPFDNLGSPDQASVVSGITQELGSRLAAVGELAVLSHAVAVKVAETGFTVGDPGRTLEVDYVLEGSVRWPLLGSSDQLTISTRLSRRSDDQVVWGHVFTEHIDDLPNIEARIAAAITNQVGVNVTDRERETMSSRPTDNHEAYVAYLQGLHQQGGVDYSREHELRMIQAFQRAVDLDPEFAEAHAALGRAHAMFVHHGHDPSRAHLDLARQALDRASELSPDSPRVRYALGWYYYYADKDYGKALDELTIARQGLSSDRGLSAALGAIRRRRGDWLEAAQHFREAYQLDPLSGSLAHELGLTYMAMRDYQTAERFLNQSIRITPAQVTAYIYKARMYWRSTGDLERSRSTLESMPEVPCNQSIDGWYWQEVYEGAYHSALEGVVACETELKITRSWRELLAAHARALLGDDENALRTFEAARVMFQKLVVEYPSVPRLHSGLGIALAGLGLHDEAIAEGRRAVEMYPVSKDAVEGPELVINLALILTMTHDYDDALDQLEYLLSIPSGVSVPLLRLDPRWKPLWMHPRFQELTVEANLGEMD